MKKLIFIFGFMSIITLNSFSQTPVKLPIIRNFTGADTVITNGGWTIQSPVGTSLWYMKNYSGSWTANASGYYNSTNNITEQWFISPPFKVVNNTVVSFLNDRAKYLGPELQLCISTNYSGTGTPDVATWDTLAFTRAPNANYYTKVSSGNISLNAFIGKTAFIGFKYTSTTSAAMTWELDSISITGSPTSITDKKDFNQMVNQLYNPSTSELTVYSNDIKINKIDIYNMAGQKVYSKYNIGSFNIHTNIQNLSKGLYVVNILLDNGSMISKKFIK